MAERMKAIDNTIYGELSQWTVGNSKRPQVLVLGDSVVVTPWLAEVAYPTVNCSKRDHTNMTVTAL